MISNTAKSFLAVDCGAATTVVILIDQVGENFHLVARADTLSTYDAPWLDITLGVTEAIKELQQQTGRRLLNNSGRPITPQSNGGDGVDALVVVASAAKPLQVSLLGLMSPLSLESARRAITSTYAVVNNQLGLDDSSENRFLEARVKALQQTRSDLILLVGGFDSGATRPIADLAHIVSMALRLMEPAVRPQVIYAGNSQLRTEIADILGSLTSVKSTDNVRPAPGRENLAMVQEELTRLYVERRIAQLPGANTLAEWSCNTIVPSAKSFAQTISYIGEAYHVLAMGVDVGSAATTIAVKRDDFHSGATRADIGVGKNAPALLAEVAWENFQRWLPFDLSQADFKNFVLHKGLFPHTVPQTYQELWLELALLREALQLVVAEARQAWPHSEERKTDWLNWDLIIGAGQSLVRTVDPPQAAMVLLDGLEPAGICRLVLDMQGVSGMLGVLASVQSVAAAQIVHEALQFTANGPFLNLGMVVAPIGVGQFGDTALHLQMEYQDGREIDVKIPFGAIEVIPLAPNEEATLKIRSSRHFSLSPQWEPAGREVNATVNGGLLGLIVDARGRPITLAQNQEDRMQQLQDWIARLRSDENIIVSERTEVEPNVV